MDRFFLGGSDLSDKGSGKGHRDQCLKAGRHVSGCCNHLGLLELGYRFGNVAKYGQGICLGKVTTGCICEVQASRILISDYLSCVGMMAKISSRLG